MLTILKKSVVRACAVTALVISPLASADFVSADLYSVGDKLATIDTDTGLEWLKLTATDNMSIRQVATLLETDYVGFRLAYRSEVTNMVERLIPTTFNDGYTYKNWSSKQAGIYGPFATMFGWNYASVKTSYPAKYDYRSWGLYLNDNTEVSLPSSEWDVLMTGVRYTNLPKPGQSASRVYDTYVYKDQYSTSYSMDYTSIDRGVFLVSDQAVTLTAQDNPGLVINSDNARQASDVPVPSIVSLALFPLFFLRYRQS
jgi:hypothetical protein